MGGGSFCFSDYSAYSKSMGKVVDCCTRAISSGQEWHAHDIDEDLDPKNVIRECCNSDEHPNTLPVILALVLWALHVSVQLKHLVLSL